MEAADEESSQTPPPATVLQEAEEVAITGLLEEVYAPAKQRRMHYTIKEKRRVLLAIEGVSQRKAAQEQQIPRRTINTWRKIKDDMFSFEGSEKTLSQAPGRPGIIPFRGELIVFMKDARRESQPVTVTLMAAYIREEHPGWLDSYAKGKKDEHTAYKSLQDHVRMWHWKRFVESSVVPFERVIRSIHYVFVQPIEILPRRQSLSEQAAVRRGGLHGVLSF